VLGGQAIRKGSKEAEENVEAIRQELILTASQQPALREYKVAPVIEGNHPAEVSTLKDSK
jgi:hypothetical protein